MPLRSRIYWDEGRLLDLYSQVRPEPSNQLRFDSLGLKLGTGILNVTTKIKRSDGEPGWTEVLDAVVDALRESRQLDALRPETMADYEASEAEYVYEIVSVTKINLPVERRLVLEGWPPGLTVWVADPPPRLSEPKDRWDWWGSYLFLVEEILPTGPRARYFTSGVSALAQIVRLAQPDVTADALCDLGRGSSLHPIEKLTSYGGQVSQSRQVEVLYQMRYMTNEQGGWSVSDGRTHDLLGYPLAILSTAGA
jgi:hypothetical protein